LKLVEVDEAGPAGLRENSGRPNVAASTAAIAAAVLGEMTTLEVTGVFLGITVSRFDAGVFLRVLLMSCLGVVSSFEGDAAGVIDLPNS
jgi:hypothetical protein